MTIFDHTLLTVLVTDRHELLRRLSLRRHSTSIVNDWTPATPATERRGERT